MFGWPLDITVVAILTTLASFTFGMVAMYLYIKNRKDKD